MDIDFFKLDAVSADLHLIVHATEVMENAFAILVSIVAGQVPAAPVDHRKAGGGKLGQVQISRCQLRPRQRDLAFLSTRQRA